MMSPTPVSHTIVIITVMIILQIFLYPQTKLKNPNLWNYHLPTDKIEKIKIQKKRPNFR